MTALLDTRLLILEMNTTSASINKHLSEFHNWCDPAKAGISVGYARYQVINLFNLFFLLLGKVWSLFILLSVMEKLCTNQLLHLVGYCVHGIVSKVGPRLMDVRDVSWWTLPARNIDGREIFAHVGHLNHIESTIGLRGSFRLEVWVQGPVQLLRHVVGRCYKVDRRS
jgi:hypothetical protein